MESNPVSGCPWSPFSRSDPAIISPRPVSDNTSRETVSSLRRSFFVCLILNFDPPFLTANLSLLSPPLCSGRVWPLSKDSFSPHRWSSRTKRGYKLWQPFSTREPRMRRAGPITKNGRPAVLGPTVWERLRGSIGGRATRRRSTC